MLNRLLYSKGGSDSVCGRFFPLSLALLIGGFIACEATAEIRLRPVGTFHTGLYDKSAAEIPTYCQKTKQVFVVNAESGRVDVLGLGDNGSLTKVGSIDAADDPVSYTHLTLPTILLV